MGSAQQSRVQFIQRNLANLNGEQNQQNQLVGLNHIENIYLQISDNRQKDFLKFAKDLELVIIDESTPYQQKYQDNFDEIFNLDDNELQKKLKNQYDIKQSEVYIILDERAKFIQSAKRHDDKQFQINYINQQRHDLIKENKTILFLGEKQTGITSFANCFLNVIKEVELRSGFRYQLDNTMYYNSQSDQQYLELLLKKKQQQQQQQQQQQDIYYQMIDFPGIDDEKDIDQQLIKLYETINEFKIYAICFIDQNDNDRSQMFQKKVLKHFHKKDKDKILIIRTFSDFSVIENTNQRLFKQFQSQSTSFFLESLKNPINMVNMKKTTKNINLLKFEINKIDENIDTNIIKQTIILNKTLQYIDEQQQLCQDILKIIERQLKQYERQEANAFQNGSMFKDFYIYRTEMEFAEKPIEQKLKENEKIVECSRCKLSCTWVGENTADIQLCITFINRKCGYCDCHIDEHFFTDEDIIKYKRPVTIVEIDQIKKSQYDHYQNQANKSRLALEVLQQFFKKMVDNYILILSQEKQVALTFLQNNLFSENIFFQQEQSEYIKIDQIKCIVNLDLIKFINYQIQQINLYREEQLQYETRDLKRKFEHDIQLQKFKEIILKIENYI